MTMNDIPRLFEVAFPLKQTCIDSVHEKNVRHGHISTLHIWPARRPLAACRAALIATLLPDPGNEEARQKLMDRLAGKVVKLSQAAAYAVVCEEEFQGAMLTKAGTHFARLDGDRGKPLVYIDFLEVVPWNWTVPEIGQTRRYSLAGARLFERAVEQREAEGFGGRVGLHALPQSESFYSGACGMTPLGRDGAFDDLMYFELSRENAVTILSRSV